VFTGIFGFTGLHAETCGSWGDDDDEENEENEESGRQSGGKSPVIYSFEELFDEENNSDREKEDFFGSEEEGEALRRGDESAIGSKSGLSAAPWIGEVHPREIAVALNVDVERIMERFPAHVQAYLRAEADMVGNWPLVSGGAQLDSDVLRRMVGAISTGGSSNGPAGDHFGEKKILPNFPADFGAFEVARVYAELFRVYSEVSSPGTAAGGFNLTLRHFWRLFRFFAWDRASMIRISNEEVMARSYFLLRKLAAKVALGAGFLERSGEGSWGLSAFLQRKLEDESARRNGGYATPEEQYLSEAEGVSEPRPSTASDRESSDRESSDRESSGLATSEVSKISKIEGGIDFLRRGLAGSLTLDIAEALVGDCCDDENDENDESGEEEDEEEEASKKDSENDPENELSEESKRSKTPAEKEKKTYAMLAHEVPEFLSATQLITSANDPLFFDHTEKSVEHTTDPR